MRNLILFILRQHTTIFFIVLQIVCVSLIVKFNEPQRSNFIASSNVVFAHLFSLNHSVSQYFNLSTINKNLADENMALRQQLAESKVDNSLKIRHVADTILKLHYDYTVAKVINNSTQRTHNFLTIDKGWSHGIQQDMAVIGPQGIVGIVMNASKNFSTVMSVLHPHYKTSVCFKHTHYFGSLQWSGSSAQHVSLLEIPFHAAVNMGDTIITNEFSNIYPPNIMVGVVDKIKKNNHENFYSIRVKLSTDFKNLEYVYVVQNLYKTEREILEQLTY